MTPFVVVTGAYSVLEDRGARINDALTGKSSPAQWAQLPAAEGSGFALLRKRCSCCHDTPLPPPVQDIGSQELYKREKNIFQWLGQ